MKKFLALTLLLATSPTFAQAQYQMTIAVVTDWQTVQTFGGPTATQQGLQARIDDANKVFESQIGLQLVVSSWTIPTSADDDYPNTDTQPYFLLDSLVTYREASSFQCQQGATILMTTRVLTDNILGIANTDSACYGQAAGIVEVNFGVTDDWQIFAHEMGHILGANHDGDPNGSCPNEPVGEYIMTPESYYNSTQEFSPCSVEVMKASLTNEEHVCITAINAAPAPAPTPSDPSSGGGKGGGGSIDWLVIGALFFAALLRFRPIACSPNGPFPKP